MVIPLQGGHHRHPATDAPAGQGQQVCPAGGQVWANNNSNNSSQNSITRPAVVSISTILYLGHFKS